MKFIIGFSHAKSFWQIGSTIIQEAEKRPYSHTYVRVKDATTGYDLVYQAGGKQGIHVVTYDGFKTGNVPVKEYEIEVPEAVGIFALRWMQTALGVPYSYLQIIRIAIGKVFHTTIANENGPTSMICSEFTGRVCSILGIRNAQRLDAFTPSDQDFLLEQRKIRRIL